MIYSLSATPYGSRSSGSPADADPPSPGTPVFSRPRAGSVPVTRREVVQVRSGVHETRRAGRDFSSDDEWEGQEDAGAAPREQAPAVVIASRASAQLRQAWFAAKQAQQDAPAPAVKLCLRKVAAGHTPVRLTRTHLRLQSQSPDSDVEVVDSTGRWSGYDPARTVSTPPAKSCTPSPEPVAAIAGFTLASARTDAAGLRQAIADGHGAALLGRMGAVLDALPDYPAARSDGKAAVPAKHAEWLALARLLADSCVPRDGKSQSSMGVEALAQGLPLSVRASLLMALATQVHASGVRPRQQEDGMRLARLARCIVDEDLVGQPLALQARKLSLTLDMQALLALASDVAEGRIDATHEGYDLGRVIYACHVLVPFTGFFSPAERLAAAFAAQAK